MRTKASLYLVLSTLSLLPQTAFSDTTDFGGYPERFHGAGDKIPPECQIDVPRSATSPFFVKWNCVDDNARSDDLRTELWIYRKGAPNGQLLGNFLGFPASVQIDAGALGVTDFSDGLPVKFRLLARDTAGIATVSSFFTVQAQDNSVDRCDLRVETEATDSTETTTGTPALSVVLDDATVETTQNGSDDAGISTSSATTADPCEISSLCSDENHVTFSSSLTLASDGTASGTLVVSPGNVNVTVSGTATVDSSVLKSVSVNGTTTIDGTQATVTLSCAQ